MWAESRKFELRRHNHKLSCVTRLAAKIKKQKSPTVGKRAHSSAESPLTPASLTPRPLRHSSSLAIHDSLIARAATRQLFSIIFGRKCPVSFVKSEDHVQGKETFASLRRGTGAAAQTDTSGYENGPQDARNQKRTTLERLRD